MEDFINAFLPIGFMAKKGIICGEEAAYRIKDNADFDCEDCAVEKREE